MIKSLSPKQKAAQSAVEYLLLLGVMTAVALVGFRVLLPKVNKSSELYYNKAANAILDRPPDYANMEPTKVYP